jgi:hypothetical protein
LFTKLAQIQGQMDVIKVQNENNLKRYDEDHSRLEDIMDKVHLIELKQYELIQQIETKMSKLNVKIEKNTLIVSIVTAVFVSVVPTLIRSLF